MTAGLFIVRVSWYLASFCIKKAVPDFLPVSPPELATYSLS